MLQSSGSVTLADVAEGKPVRKEPVSISVEELSDALGSCPDGLMLALELAERLGTVRIDGERVELPWHAVERLGLVRDGGRWRAEATQRDALNRPVTTRPGGPRRRTARRRARHTLPLLHPGNTADPRAVEPHEELQRIEAGPTNRIDSLCRWLDRWSAGQPPLKPTDVEAIEAEGEPRRPMKTATDERKARAGSAEKARKKKRSQPPRKPANIDLKALRLRLDAQAKAAG